MRPLRRLSPWIVTGLTLVLLTACEAIPPEGRTAATDRPSGEDPAGAAWPILAAQERRPGTMPADTDSVAVVPDTVRERTYYVQLRDGTGLRWFARRRGLGGPLKVFTGPHPTLLIRLTSAQRATLRSDTLVRFIVPRDSVDEPLSRSLEELGRYAAAAGGGDSLRDPSLPDDSLLAVALLHENGIAAPVGVLSKEGWRRPPHATWDSTRARAGLDYRRGWYSVEGDGFGEVPTGDTLGVDYSPGWYLWGEATRPEAWCEKGCEFHMRTNCTPMWKIRITDLLVSRPWDGWPLTPEPPSSPRRELVRSWADSALHEAIARAVEAGEAPHVPADTVEQRELGWIEYPEINSTQRPVDGRHLFHLHVRRVYTGTAERRVCIYAEIEAWLWVGDGRVRSAGDVGESFHTVDCDFSAHGFEALAAVRDGPDGEGVVVFGRERGYESLSYSARLVTADSVGDPFARDEADARAGARDR